MFCMLKKKIHVSKHKSNRKKQVILLILRNGEGREAKSEGRRLHYLAVKTTISVIKRNSV